MSEQSKSENRTRTVLDCTKLIRAALCELHQEGRIDSMDLGNTLCQLDCIESKFKPRREE